MIWEYLFFALGAMLLMLPLLPALLEWAQKSTATPLNVNPAHDGNIQYFAKRFSAFINQELTTIKQLGTLTGQLSSYHFNSDDEHLIPSAEEALRRRIDRIVVSEHSLRLPQDYSFSREIYVKDSILGDYGNTLRAALVLGTLELRAHSSILRWAHARSVRLGPGCTVFGRLSAKEMILLTPNCAYKRLHAPTILFFTNHDNIPLLDIDDQIDPAKPVGAIQPGPAQKTGRWLIKEDFHIPAGGHLNTDIVVYGNLSIGSNTIIEGNIKCYGELTLDDGACIKGALTSEKNIHIGQRCRIDGPLIAEGEIDIGAGSVIGHRRQPTSVTANSIKPCDRVVTHGTLWSRRLGPGAQAKQAEQKACA